MLFVITKQCFSYIFPSKSNLIKQIEKRMKEKRVKEPRVSCNIKPSALLDLCKVIICSNRNMFCILNLSKTTLISSQWAMFNILPITRPIIIIKKK